MPNSTKKSSLPADDPVAKALATFSPKLPDLELPDWSGCNRTPRPMTLEQMHRHSELLLRCCRRARRTDPADQPVGAEFQL